MFDPGAATLFAFRIAAAPGTAFCYVLPWSPREALVELVTREPIDPEPLLRAYLQRAFALTAPEILDHEAGVSPMTEQPFPWRDGDRVRRIGIAAGMLTPSTGYALTRILDDCAAMVRRLKAGGDALAPPRNSRLFRLLDRVMLEVWEAEPAEIPALFAALFRRNPGARGLRFLDERSPLGEVLRLAALLPRAPLARRAAPDPAAAQASCAAATGARPPAAPEVTMSTPPLPPSNSAAQRTPWRTCTTRRGAAWRKAASATPRRCSGRRWPWRSGRSAPPTQSARAPSRSWPLCSTSWIAARRQWPCTSSPWSSRSAGWIRAARSWPRPSTTWRRPTLTCVHWGAWRRPRCCTSGRWPCARRPPLRAIPWSAASCTTRRCSSSSKAATRRPSGCSCARWLVMMSPTSWTPGSRQDARQPRRTLQGPGRTLEAAQFYERALSCRERVPMRGGPTIEELRELLANLRAAL